MTGRRRAAGDDPVRTAHMYMWGCLEGSATYQPAVRVAMIKAVRLATKNAYLTEQEAADYLSRLDVNGEAVVGE